MKVAKVEPKKNGIRDLHLALSNLREAAITQVTVNCQTEKGPTGWRLDTSNSQDWPLVLRRSGTEAWADLFLEPPDGDCHQKDFTINVTYADGQSANATVKAGEHTDPKLAVDPKGPAAPSSGAWVYLAGEEKLFGKLERLGEESLRLTTPWGDHLDVPLARVAGVHFGLPDRKESPESFAKTAEVARDGGPAPGQDEGRRGRRDLRHPGRDRRRPACASATRTRAGRSPSRWSRAW